MQNISMLSSIVQHTHRMLCQNLLTLGSVARDRSAAHDIMSSAPSVIVCTEIAVIPGSCTAL